jgi:hypothetical protein
VKLYGITSPTTLDGKAVIPDSREFAETDEEFVVYIIMEYMDTNLRALIPNITPPQQMSVALSVARGM